MDLLSGFDGKDCIHGHEIPGLKPVIEGDDLVFLVAQRNPGLEIRPLGLLLPVDHHFRCDAGRFVHLLHNRQAFDHVHVIGDAFLLGDEGKRIGIPFGKLVAAAGLGLVLDQKPGPVRKPVAGPVAALRIDQRQFRIAGHDDLNPLAVFDRGTVFKSHLAIDVCLDSGLLGAALYGAADVEGPHRQLGAGFADRLRGNDADGLADVDRCAASQIAPVAPAADSFLQGAGQNAADEDGFEFGGFYLNAGFLFDHYSRFD